MAFVVFNGPRSRARLLANASWICVGAFLAHGAVARAEAASDPAAAPSATLGEVVVTASRRTETVSKLPFNISAYGSQQIERSNITSVAALSQAVPNFVIQDVGARSTATSIPIIRGLNASQPAVTSARYFQTPVGFYIGNAPLTGSLPIEDIDRVEVLRGPQGTLYGAGALAGAVRIVPTDPKLGVFSGQVSASGSAVAHSSDHDYDVSGVVNVPIGETAAVRIVAKHQYEAGFIDQNDILKRTGDNYVSGAPVLANPGDVANSPAVYFNARDVNYDQTTSVRASLLWKPTPKFSLQLSYNFAYVKGNGSPTDDYTYGGGVSPIDSRFNLAATGDYTRSLPMLEPFSRTTHLGTVDASYDLGFATLSGTFAYGVTHGAVATDQTVTLLGTPYGFYYTGVPANPRVVIPVTNEDDENNYTEEVRLVSKQGGRFDYIVGAFFEQNRRHIGLEVWAPGADAQSAAAHGGATTPIVEGGTYVPVFPSGATYYQETQQAFNDYSLYGDLTWHVNDLWQITGGARVFHQTFNQFMWQDSSLFEFDNTFDNSSSLTSQIFKFNTSYKLGAASQAYFTFSQGFRRGGANAFPVSGAVLEPAALLSYQPDKTNNYEAGVKGTAFRLYYNLDVFYVDWSHPQIDLLTPYNLTSVVVNANGAASKGVEFELSGPIGPRGLSFNLGLAYARARLTQDFGLPAGSGAGTVIQNAIVGLKGDRLPGAPDFSGAFNLNYRIDLRDASSLTFTIGADYRSSTLNILPNINPTTPATKIPGYGLLHGSIEYDLNDWQFSLFGTNLADTHAVISKTIRTQYSVQTLGGWGDSYVVARPREVGLRVTRRW